VSSTSSSDPALPMTDQPNDTAAPATEIAAADSKKKQGTDWWAELRAIFWLVLAVLAFHTFIAKPFYIPSFHILPEMKGRLFGRMPKRGDVVILTPPGETSDYIKRVIGLPGDTIQMVNGQLILNGKPVKREARPATMIPIDDNLPCADNFGQDRVPGPDGKLYCRLTVFRETLPDGRYYDTIDEGPSGEDNYGPVTVPADHVFLMGDNRDNSADSRVAASDQGLGGPVPWENIGGRAEFITFSYDGSSKWLNPVTWFTALRGGRAGTSLRPQEAKKP